MATKLEVSTQGGYHRFTVSFSNEAQALAYVKARSKTHNVYEIKDAPIPDSWTQLLKWLYPICHHGLALDLCMDPYGPHHFGTAEWERQQYGDH